MGTNLKVFAVVIATLGLYTWVANAIPQLESVVPEELSFSGEVSEAELVSAGQELFAGAGGCTACHGLGTRAPNLLTDHEGQGTIGQRCAGRVPGQDCKQYIHESMLNPTGYVVEGFDPMVFQARVYSDAQIWALVAYLQAQGGEVTVTGADIQTAEAQGGSTPAMPPPSAATDPLDIMRANLCFGCHKLGEEGIELGPSFDGMGGRINANRIRRSILDPGAEAAAGFDHLLGSMPPNLGDMLTARQLETLVRFLSEQRG